MVFLEILNLVTHYNTMRGVVRAVDGVSISVDRGEALGIVGETGSGKTTLALSVTRLLPPNARIVKGEVLLDGKDLVKMSEKALRSVRWRDVSIIFQGSMNALDPVKSIGEQIAEPIEIHQNLPRSRALSRAKELLETVGISSSRAKSYPHELSGGMRQRVMIAMSLATNPRLVIADEPATGLDVMVKAQILDLMKKLQKEFNLSIVMISHDLSTIAETCDRVAVMYAGKIVERGPSETVFTKPLHPYTQRLVKAFPRIERPGDVIESIPGNPPDLIDPPTGCRFNPRCPLAMDICRKSEPELLEVGKNHYAACYAISEN